MPGNIVGEAWVAIRPDLSGFTASLTASVAESLKEANAFANTNPIRIRLDTTHAYAQLLALKTAIAATTGTVSVGGGDGGGGNIAAAAAGAAAGGAGRGGGGTGLATLLGLGGGFAGLAGIGSVLSLAGFGFEHVVTTAIGLVGSLAGALGGLGVLAVGVFGKMAVGMGSDALVMKSVIADTQTFYTSLTALQLAQVTYGKNSAQAAAATQALNIQMQILGNTAGVKAELGLAKMAFALNTFWDKATSSARVAAVKFLEPFFSVAYTYIPLINEAATRNFNLMTSAFKPLIDWANGPATAIFKNLENLFAADIPIGVGVLTNFVELLAKIAKWAAPQTGGLLASLEHFLAYLNTTAGFTKLEGFMTTLVGMFHDWWDLIKQIGITLYDVFDQSVGLGTNIVTTLTGMLKTLDNYLISPAGKAALHNLFTVHLQEVLALLGAAASAIGIFGQLYLAVAPALTKLATGLIEAVTWMVKIPVLGPILGWIGAIALLANTMNLLALGVLAVKAAGWGASLFSGAGGVTAGSATALAQSGSIGGLLGSVGGAAGVTGGAAGVTGAGIVGAAALGFVGLIAADFQLWTGKLKGPLGKIASVVGVFTTIVNPFLSGAVWIATHLTTVGNAITGTLKAIGHWWSTFSWSGTLKTVGNAITGLLGSIGHWFATFSWTGLQTTIRVNVGNWVNGISGWFGDQVHKIPGVLGTVWSNFVSWGGDIGDWFHNQVAKIPGTLATVWNTFVSWGGDIGSWFTTWSNPKKIDPVLGKIWTAFLGFVGAITQGLTTLGNGISNFFIHAITGKSPNSKVLPNWYPGQSGANGAFVDQPTAMIIGHGPEVVLNRSQFRAMMGGAAGWQKVGGAGVNLTQHFYIGSNAQRSDVEQAVRANNARLVRMLAAGRRG